MPIDEEGPGAERIEQEKPQADWQDQRQDVDPEPEVDVTTPPSAVDEGEADALDAVDQLREVPLDEDDLRD